MDLLDDAFAGRVSMTKYSEAGRVLRSFFFLDCRLSSKISRG